MSTAPVFHIQNLGKYYTRGGGRLLWVLKNLSFVVMPGEFLTIVGPSGAGKTTLLNVLAQIDVANAGEMHFQSEPLPIGDHERLEPGLSCRVGYVMQEDNLLPWRTTLQNILLPLEIQRCLTVATREVARRLIRAVGLSGFEDYYPHELSVGMRKRATLVRTLVYNPPIILMDEPFDGLDADTRMILQKDLLNLYDSCRKTIIFVTHDIAEAITLGDRLLLLSRAPASVQQEYVISIERPRDVRNMLASQEFWNLYWQIKRELQGSAGSY